jgi:hypothetical protein
MLCRVLDQAVIIHSTQEITMSQKQFVALEMTELSKLIGRIGKQKVALDNAVQHAAVQCIFQSIQFRNATPAMSLFENLGTSSRRDALVSYFEQYGNLAWSKSDKKLMFFDAAKVIDGKKALKWTDDYAEEVAGVIWYTTKKEPTPKSVYDMEEEFSKVLDRLTKVANKAGNEVKHKGLLDVLTTAYRRYQFEALRTEVVQDQQVIAETERQQAAFDAKQGTQVDMPGAVAKLQDHFGKSPELQVAA